MTFTAERHAAARTVLRARATGDRQAIEDAELAVSAYLDDDDLEEYLAEHYPDGLRAASSDASGAPALTGVEVEQLGELRRQLDEAYDHYFTLSDGYSKSTDGQIQIELGTYWDREGAISGSSAIRSISVYSYVFGPNRTHLFPSLDAALSAVREWNARELTTTYDEHGDVISSTTANGGE